jgi:hypothetical protein
MELPQIDPITTGTLSITVRNSVGALVADAAAVADVYKPSGQRVADDIALTNLGSGIYALTIDSAWSSSAGKPILGVFWAIITVTKSGQTRTKRFRYLVDFTD